MIIGHINHLGNFSDKYEDIYIRFHAGRALTPPASPVPTGIANQPQLLCLLSE